MMVDQPVVLPEADLPPTLVANPIRAASAPASRTLSMVVTALVYMGLFLGGFGLLRLSQRADSQTLMEDRQTVRLLIQDGPAFNEPVGGGGRAPKDFSTETRHSAEKATEALSLVANRDEVPQDSLVPLEPPKEPQALKPEFKLASLLIESSGNGVGHGEGTGTGTGIGTGVGTGSGRGRGSTWIHSASGEDGVRLEGNLGEANDYIQPHYPSDAISARISGDVDIEVTIDEEGKPIKWKVVDGHPILVEASLKVLPQWQFIPLRHKGKKVRATFEVRIRFTLM